MELIRKITPGPWQVIVDKYPHYLGGEHIERRIFTVYDDPQLKGPYSIVSGRVGLPEEKGGKPRHMVSINKYNAKLIAMAPLLLEFVFKASSTSEEAKRLLYMINEGNIK